METKLLKKSNEQHANKRIAFCFIFLQGITSVCMHVSMMEALEIIHTSSDSLIFPTEDKRDHVGQFCFELVTTTLNPHCVSMWKDLKDN